MAGSGQRESNFIPAAMNLLYTAEGRERRQTGFALLYGRVGIKPVEQDVAINDLNSYTGGWTYPWDLVDSEGHAVLPRKRLIGYKAGSAMISSECELGPIQSGTRSLLVYRGRNDLLRGVILLQRGDRLKQALKTTSNNDGLEPITYTVRHVRFPLWGNFYDDPRTSEMEQAGWIPPDKR